MRRPKPETQRRSCWPAACRPWARRRRRSAPPDRSDRRRASTARRWCRCARRAGPCTRCRGCSRRWTAPELCVVNISIAVLFVSGLCYMSGNNGLTDQTANQKADQLAHHQRGHQNRQLLGAQVLQNRSGHRFMVFQNKQTNASAMLLMCGAHFETRRAFFNTHNHSKMLSAMRLCRRRRRRRRLCLQAHARSETCTHTRATQSATVREMLYIHAWRRRSA